jgi:kynureninase
VCTFTPSSHPGKIDSRSVVSMPDFDSRFDVVMNMNTDPIHDTASAFHPDEKLALKLDSDDPLKYFRDQFHIPLQPDGRPAIYFCGHSLGLLPKSVRPLLEKELDAWATLGIEGHFRQHEPWFTYHELVREPLARLVGARPAEVVAMNGLTVNLHLMMATFYDPLAVPSPGGGLPARYKVLIEEPTFPSDRYAVASHVRHHGLDPAVAVLGIGPDPGEHVISIEKLENLLDQHGSEISLVLLSAVNYLSGQFFDVERITAAAHRKGCVVGFDLAHAIGNVMLKLHDWQVDFAVWCNYKYLNGGPGGVGGCFIHEKHATNVSLPRLAGWWGNDPTNRMAMLADFEPLPDAAGWQISNPPILALVPLRASLDMFDQVGLPALRQKSERLTAYLHYLLDALPAGRFRIITPRTLVAPSAEGHVPEHGCQVSLIVQGRPRELLRALEEEGIWCDFRSPDVLRVAPVPFYNTFHEVWTFVRALGKLAGDCG